jgi:DNA-directed RNA polymerase subunit L
MSDTKSITVNPEFLNTEQMKETPEVKQEQMKETLEAKLEQMKETPEVKQEQMKETLEAKLEQMKETPEAKLEQMKETPEAKLENTSKTNIKYTKISSTIKEFGKIVDNIRTENDILYFNLQNIDVSFINALRRTIISDIPCIVFKTAPYKESKCNIITNTSKLDNEILKHRLSCVPIHITDLEFPIDKYNVEINVKNDTSKIIYVTTKDFKLKIKDHTNNNTDEISEEDNDKIFPKNNLTNYYIDFLKLYPTISDEIMGEQLHLICGLSIESAKTNAAYNQTSICTYNNIIDQKRKEIELNKKIHEWKNTLNSEQIKMQVTNWELIDGKRIYLNNNFEFQLKSIGVYKNSELVSKGCDVLIIKLESFINIIGQNKLTIIESTNTLHNGYDVILENEDYTIGMFIKYILYDKYYGKVEDNKILSFCGFEKKHPHDNYSRITIAFHNEITIPNIYELLIECCNQSINIFKKIKESF